MINRIEIEKAYAFFGGCPRITRITRIESCKAAFLRRQSRLMPQHAAKIRVIREIRGQTKK
jgi:hypothetical protein